MTKSIALLPGDGIGPEVVDAAVRVLNAIGRRFDSSWTMRAWPVGGAALRAGKPPLPPETLDACLAADAVLLGAIGDPEFDREPIGRRPETALLSLRGGLQVFANLRPARVWPGLEHLSPLKHETIVGTDFLIVRELTGGLYFGEPRGLMDDGAFAINTLRYSVEEIERIARAAFDAARQRRRRVTSVDKANVLETSQLWRSVVSRVGIEYTDVQLDHMYVDACAMFLVRAPQRFDVILTENLFGDILSDEAGAVVGSLGLLPSASLGSGPGLFEPVHGSAPDIAGKNLANPIGAIASVAMLLRQAFHADEEARAIEESIDGALRDGCRTADLLPPSATGAITCSAMADEIARRVAG